MAVGSHDLELVESLGRTTWRAQLDGASFVARRLNGHIDTATVERMTATHQPALVPISGIAVHDGAHWLLSADAPGVSLERMLLRATLTPAQAAQVASGVLTALAELHGAGVTHGMLHAENVLVGPDGTVRLADWAVSSLLEDPGPVDADIASVRELLAELARNAGRPTAHAHKHAAHYADLVRMEQLASTLGAEELTAAARELAQPAGVTDELAALVAAMGSSHRVVTGPRVLPPEPQPDPLPALPLTVPDALRRTGRAVPWRWIAVAAAIVVAVAAYPVINALRSHPSAAHQAAGTRPAASSHAPARKPVVVAKTRPVPQVAPRSAGFITKITQLPETTCRAGSPCAITVRIFIGQLTDTATMSWSFVVVDRCTGAQTPVAGGTMIAEPWWRSAYDTRTVQLPAGRALAVVARVDDPVQAASAPLFVSDGRTAC